jgi:hypothetical protein
MHEVATISFRDAESGDQAAAIIRQNAATIGFCLLLENNGDIEILCRRTIAAEWLIP